MAEHPGAAGRRLSRDVLTHGERREANLEAQLLGQFAKLIKLPKSQRGAMYDRAQKYGRQICSADFRATATFPVYLTVCTPQNLLDKAKSHRLFNLYYMMQLPLVQQFFDDKQEMPNETDPHCMLIKWPYFGMVVMHDLDSEESHPGVRFSYTDVDRQFSIEPAADFIRTLDTYGDWRLEEY